MNLRNIFFFDRMLTPKIILVIYWLAIAFFMLFALRGIVVETLEVPQAIAVIVGGPILARLWTELAIVLFKINENLQVLADRASASRDQ